MNDKKLLIIPLALLMAALLLLVKPGGLLWQSVAAGENNDVVVVATIRGEDFSMRNPEKEREGLITSYTRDVEEIKLSAVGQEVLFREACARGVSVSPREVDDYIAELQEGISGSQEAYAAFLEELEWQGLSEDEYWRRSRREYLKILVTGKFCKQLEEEYWKTHQWTATQSFYDYYMDVYRWELFEKYDVIMK